MIHKYLLRKIIQKKKKIITNTFLQNQYLKLLQKINMKVGCKKNWTLNEILNVKSK